MLRKLKFFIITFFSVISASVSSQPFPSKPVKIVIPVAAAGAMDPLARAVASRLSDIWKYPVLVENRAGANGIIGADYVSKSEPDGYILFMSEASPFVMNPHLYKKLPFDGLTGFTPITLVSQVPWVLGVHTSIQANNLKELVALAKAQPGKLSYGSIGLGSSVQIRMEQLKNALGVDIIHVPYKGAGPAMTDLIAGQISMIMITPGLVEPHVRTGKLKLIASATTQRLVLLPNLPTIAESGIPGYEAGTWFGMMGPPKMAPELVNKINADMKTVLNSTAFQQQYISGNWMVTPPNQTPEEFGRFLRADYEKWGSLIRQVGVTID